MVDVCGQRRAAQDPPPNFEIYLNFPTHSIYDCNHTTQRHQNYRPLCNIAFFTTDSGACGCPPLVLQHSRSGFTTAQLRVSDDDTQPGVLSATALPRAPNLPSWRIPSYPGGRIGVVHAMCAEVTGRPGPGRPTSELAPLLAYNMHILCTCIETSQYITKFWIRPFAAAARV